MAILNTTIQATSFLGEVGAGVTKPFRLECNGEIFISKVIDDDVGNKHLINEYVCYNLAKLLKVPIPDASLIHIDKTIIDSVEYLRERNIKSQILFGSKLIGSAQTIIAPPLLEIVVNKEDIPSIILFDQIIYNNDRAANKGNLIFDYKKKQLFIIDHTHVFKDGGLWNASTLVSINENQEYLINNFHGKYYKMLQRYVSGNNLFENY